MSITSILKWVLVAFVIWWVVEQPGNAGHLIDNIAGLLSSMATGFSHFITSI